MRRRTIAKVLKLRETQVRAGETAQLRRAIKKTNILNQFS